MSGRCDLCRLYSVQPSRRRGAGGYLFRRERELERRRAAADGGRSPRSWGSLTLGAGQRDAPAVLGPLPAQLDGILEEVRLSRLTSDPRVKCESTLHCFFFRKMKDTRPAAAAAGGLSRGDGAPQSASSGIALRAAAGCSQRQASMPSLQFLCSDFDRRPPEPAAAIFSFREFSPQNARE